MEDFYENRTIVYLIFPGKKLTALAGNDFQLLLRTEKEKEKQNKAGTMNISAIEWRDTSIFQWNHRNHNP